jgi:hypothetical protein
MAKEQVLLGEHCMHAARNFTSGSLPRTANTLLSSLHTNMDTGTAPTSEEGNALP